MVSNPAHTAVDIFTDGACRGNPGPGGWGVLLKSGGHEKEMWGGEAATTNNRMELLAVIRALAALKRPVTARVHTDSQYVQKGISEWIHGWKARGWRKADKKPALNPDLWHKLLRLCEYHKVSLHWVKGHAANEKNNRCDQLAVAESKKF